MQKVLLLLLGFPSGIAIIYYRKRIVDFTGTFPSVDNVLGAGGTYTLLIIVGLLVSFGTVAYAFGFLDQYLNGTLLNLNIN